MEYVGLHCYLKMKMVYASYFKISRGILNFVYGNEHGLIIHNVDKNHAWIKFGYNLINA